ncbi:probable LRR receptor-like serine/threonine-protein kinase At1g67720 isoform X2 [Cryptomeria japonica]|uniref:probable LRR receptor-like serine/threonine-protein kinase At1g67720 isoform X2 n=1 Tax=Cryptomeria japonica TaxID=3369 RepID=UPI0027D9FE43|nr:probable LRR receptor-like serine/threonine-protein kinase At1g67720 isoform X2 [Cryptomeria japonica]
MSGMGLTSSGFLNINCGAIDNVTDDNGLLWISDSPFINSRNTSTTRTSETMYLQFWTLAYFPNLTVKKYCYLFPVKPGLNYLVRASFGPDYTVPLARFFDIVIEGIKWSKVDLSGLDNTTFRCDIIILAAKSDSLSLCLARNSQTERNHYVFISSIELRPLESSMYNSTDFQKNALDVVGSINFGAYSDSLQYPDDPFDRLWSSSVALNSTVNITANDDQTKSLGRELVNKPPLNVLRTAIGTEGVTNITLSDIFDDISEPGVYSFALYFCNINMTNATQRFAAFINENQISDYIELKFLQCWQANKDLQLNTSDPINIILQPSTISEVGPFINGAEMFRTLDVHTTTYFGDVVAIRKIAETINVPDDWTRGDPCLPSEYSSTGITCSQDDPPRVIIINLTRMRLEGIIPTNIADLTALTQLLLGNNNLSGHIPDLRLLKNLTKLQLQNNQLTGEIPESLEKLQMLTQLFLQDNKLEGTVSKRLLRSSLDLRVDPQNAIPEGSRKINGWVIGLSIGCSVVLVLVIFSGILLRRHKHPLEHLLTTDVPISSQQHISADENIQNDYHRLAIEYTEEDIKTSTANYSTLIGKGSFGSVFYGRLSGYEVAVKILGSNSTQGQQEFQNEVTVLSRIYHKNLVNLIGYCRQSIMALVYEYMPGGTLTDHLYGVARLVKPLDWNTRLTIAQQTADGLLYLHQGCYPPIIHRDIKCSNILLDNRMSAKVADFGISKLVESSKGYTITEVKGSMGYLDPEYFATSSLNEKTDVYSFGVVLLEIISGVSPKDGTVQSAHNLLSCGKLAELMDSSLGSRYNVESAWKVADIAYQCVEKESTNRPKMSAVVKELEEAVTLASGEKSDSASNTMAFSNIGDMPSPR